MVTKVSIVLCLIAMMQFGSSLRPKASPNSDENMKALIEKLTGEIRDIENETKNIKGDLDQTKLQELKDSLTKKIQGMKTEIANANNEIEESAWEEEKGNLVTEIQTLHNEIDKINGFLKESTNHYPFMGKGSTDVIGTNRAITYDIAKLDGNGAFDPKSGIFTAPVKGMYYFSFSGQRETQYKSGSPKFTAKLVKGRSPNDANPDILAEGHINYNYRDDSFFQVSVHATVLLEKGEGVWVKLLHGLLRGENTAHTTTFTGFLIQKVDN